MSNDVPASESPAASPPIPQPKPKDFWDIMQILASMFIPIVGLLVGHWFSQEQKEANEMVRQADRLSLLIRHLASDNPRERRIAIDVSQYLASRDQLPAEIIPSIINLADNDAGAEVAKAASEVLAKVEESNTAVALEIKQSAANIPPRVYWHINREDQRALAEDLSRELQEFKGGELLRFPGITLVNGPRQPELRYFKPDDKADAEELGAALKRLGLDLQVRDFSTRVPNADKIRPRHFELWLGEFARN